MASLKSVVLCAAALAVLLPGPRRATAQETAPSTYAEEIEQWKAYRHQRITSESGYLALTGLFWIPGDGRYSFGADPTGDLVFPGEGVPPRLGALTFSGDVIMFSADPTAEVKIGGSPVTSARLYHDNDEGHEATELQWGTLTWWIIERGQRFGVRLRDSKSPTLRDFKGVDRYPTDIGWRIEGRFEKYDPPKLLDIVDIHGNLSREWCPGALVFERGGKEYRLEGTAGAGDDQYFLIFGDKTNGRETYGGGRFLYVDAADAKGNVVIDFNKAYSPWCAFSDYTTCQLPPEQNRLPIDVTAGEKDYKYKKH